MKNISRRKFVTLLASAFVGANVPLESLAKAQPKTNSEHLQNKVDRWVKNASPYILATEAFSLTRDYGTFEKKRPYPEIQYNRWTLRSHLNRFLANDIIIQENVNLFGKKGQTYMVARGVQIPLRHGERTRFLYTEYEIDGKINPGVEETLVEYRFEDIRICSKWNTNFGTVSLPQGVTAQDAITLQCVDQVQIQENYHRFLQDFFKYLDPQYQEKISFRK